MSAAAPNPFPGEIQFEKIPTIAVLIRVAHDASAASMALARQYLVLLYGKAIRSYLGAFFRNDDDADEVAHNVVVRILQGRFRNWTPDKGRFRWYLKAAVRKVALSYLAERGKAVSVLPDALKILEGAADPKTDAIWTSVYREATLASARAVLKDQERETALEEARLKVRSKLAEYEQKHAGNAFATLLDLMFEHPEADSETLAARLEEMTGRTYSADAVRQQLCRLRPKLAALLLDDVRASLPDPSPEAVEEELRETGLWPYVQNYLPPDWRTRGTGSGPA